MLYRECFFYLKKGTQRGLEQVTQKVRIRGLNLVLLTSRGDDVQMH